MSEDARTLRPREWAAAIAVALGALIVLRPASITDPYWWDAAAVYVPGARWLAENDFLATPGVFPSLLGRGHTPLYYVITAIAFAIFGSAPAVGHAIVLGFSAIGLAYTYALGTWLGGRPAGIAAAILTGVAPLWLTMSSQALPEIPLATLTIASLYEFARGRHWAAAGWGVLVVLTKETGLACTCAIFGASVLWWLRDRDPRARRAGLVATIPAIALLGFFVWQRVAEGWWVLPYHQELFETEHSLAEQGWYVFGTIALAQGRWAALIAAIAIGAWRWRRGSFAAPARDPIATPRPWTLAALALVIVANQVFFTKMWFLDRYALAAHPPFAVLIALALLPESTASRRVLLAGALPIAVSAVLSVALRWSGTGYESGETTFRYLRMIEAHQRLYARLEALEPAPVILTTWPMTEELRDPELGWVRRRYRALGSGYFEEPVPIDAIVTAEGLGAHQELLAEAERLGMQRSFRADVDGAVIELWVSPTSRAQ